MSYFSTTFLLLLFLAFSSNVIGSSKELEMVGMAREGLLHALSWAQGYKKLDGPGHDSGLADCVKLYEEAEPRLARLVMRDDWSHDDAVTWLSAALASHATCLDGLRDTGLFFEARRAEDLTSVIRNALATYGAKRSQRAKRTALRRPGSNQARGLLASWDAAASTADFVVAQDGSGNYRTINEAVSALARLGNNRPERSVIYVKSGVYKEKVEIGRDMKNVMFVGDGMDKTVVTGNQNVQDGASTISSATFGVSGDGFWARDMTFENTAGPQKHQAVALRDFIFGDAATVFQNCDILVRKPMDHQSNMITAQGRDDPNENTGISIVNSRVGPAPDFRVVKGRFKSYLGRPWKKYSRTVFLKTDLDGLVDERGWKEWSGDVALSTLYYAEYMNTGIGASTHNRVKWPGFHVLSNAGEASRFTVRNFIGGDSWIPATGVPFWAEIYVLHGVAMGGGAVGRDAEAKQAAYEITVHYRGEVALLKDILPFGYRYAHLMTSIGGRALSYVPRIVERKMIFHCSVEGRSDLRLSVAKDDDVERMFKRNQKSKKIDLCVYPRSIRWNVEVSKDSVQLRLHMVESILEVAGERMHVGSLGSRRGSVSRWVLHITAFVLFRLNGGSRRCKELNPEEIVGEDDRGESSWSATDSVAAAVSPDSGGVAAVIVTVVVADDGGVARSSDLVGDCDAATRSGGAAIDCCV
ncbi:hypothetical protein BUALT_Bualt01G0119300 [Buddleja alternifolia]|uniref:Pectinesterase n=1 Tax=Buddleja alternifolia TaxID=168488 RepID=A0AAV6Y7W7_9LAMI|nr:hypothetical protein BUALT_Bualt01G0119300 [Buddleja alternifolia]